MASQSVQDVRPRSLLLGHHRHVAGIRSTIDDLKLRGKDFRANVTDAVTDAPVIRTIEAASTVQLVLNDPRGKVRKSKLLEERFDIGLDGLFFRFVACSKQGDSLTLSFEDREVARLRQHKGAKKAFRDKVTRAEFVLMMLREVGDPRIPAWIPELHVEQPIEDVKGAGQKDSNLSETQTAKGLDKHANVTVKGKKASPSQIKIGEKALRVAASVSAPFDAAAALICALITESLMGAASSNYLQLTGPKSGSSPTASIESQSQAFLLRGFTGAGGAIHFAKDTHDDIAEIAQDVQGSGAGSASHGHSNYGPYVDEARKWVEAYKGGIGGATLTVTKTRKERYAFERKKNENSWHAITRLAQEVEWVAFVSNGIFYYASEPEFLSAKVQMRVNDDAPGIDSIDFDWDLGKKVTELTVNGRAKAWAAPPGTVAEVDGQGPADGRYIVSQIDSNLFNDTVTVTLKRPTKPLPEPAPETKQVTKTRKFPGGATGDASALVRWAKKYVGTQEGSKLQIHWANMLGVSPSVPWCGVFVGAGIRETTDLKLPSNPAYSGDWLSWSDGHRIPKEKRQAGDIMVFDWGDGGITDHVGICIGHGKMVSGNYGDQVTLSDDRSSNCVGVVRPKGF